MNFKSFKSETILFIAQSYTTGGVVRVITELLNNWPKEDQRRLLLIYNRGHGGKNIFARLAQINKRVEIEEIRFWDISHLSIELRKEKTVKKYILKVLYRFINIWYYIKKILYFFHRCKIENVQIVYSHNGGYPGGDLNRAGIIGAKLANVPSKILIIHNLAVSIKWYEFFSSHFSDKIINWAADEIIAVSEACKEALKKRSSISIPIKKIYNGITIKESMQNYEKLNPDPWIKMPNKIAFVGEIHPRKGLDDLFEAVSMLNINYCLIVFGSGDLNYILHLRSKAKKLGIVRKVVFQGFDPLVQEKLKFIDILVLPSIAYESFGMVLLEAMLCKKPVIVSDVGGMKEIVEDRKSGFIFNFRDIEMLKNRIETLLLDRSKCKKFGSKGLEVLKNKFSAKDMAYNYYLLNRK